MPAWRCRGEVKEFNWYASQRGCGLWTRHPRPWWAIMIGMSTAIWRCSFQFFFFSLSETRICQESPAILVGVTRLLRPFYCLLDIFLSLFLANNDGLKTRMFDDDPPESQRLSVATKLLWRNIFCLVIIFDFLMVRHIFLWKISEHSNILFLARVNKNSNTFIGISIINKAQFFFCDDEIVKFFSSISISLTSFQIKMLSGSRRIVEKVITSFLDAKFHWTWRKFIFRTCPTMERK